jgi:hypothetical protein
MDRGTTRRTSRLALVDLGEYFEKGMKRPADADGLGGFK